MADRKHLLHVKSNVAEKAKQYGIDDFLITPKKPVDSETGKATDDTLLYGEIAVNYGKGVEALTIRNTEDNVVAFVNENDFYEAGEIAAAGLATEKLEREEADATEKLEREEADATEKLEREEADATEKLEREEADATEKLEREEADATEKLEREEADATEKLEREEAEFVAADAFDYLDKKIDNSAVSEMVSTTYAEIKVLREQSKLKAGQFYRITDYVTTTTQENTQSAGHVFDVIVLATDVDTLNENAKAIKHEGDTYFADSDLDAWEIKYDLDNDTTKYAWADETNGKGVIFYMKDEWNNECPYDFKNIQFKRWAITNITNTKLPSEALQELNNVFNFGGNGGKHFATKDTYGGWLPNSQGLTVTVDETKFGWYYTFNGMSSEDGETISNRYDLSINQFKLSDECLEWLEEDGSGTDTQDSCYDNKISLATLEFFADDIYSKGRRVLNNIVFNNGLSYCYYNEDDEDWEYKVSSCYGNIFGTDCVDNTFGNYCWYNSFGNDCGSNTFGNNNNNNVFGNVCQNNSFGNNNYSNTFGNYCERNTFGNDCGGNTFGNNCGGNTFGNYFRWNSFGNYCWYNSFGNYCERNTFGNYYWYNSFGNNCGGNTFGNYCWYNSFGNYCWYNSFGNNNYSNTFGNYFRWNSFGNNIQYVNFKKDYMYYNIVENGNTYITVTSSQTTSLSLILRNFTIAQGVNNATREEQRKTIFHNTTNDTFKTTYQNANSQTVDV